MEADLVLLTGATGMVGFRTLVLTLQKGYRVRTAVRDDAGFNRIKALPAVAPYTSQLESIIVPNIAVHGAYEEAVKGGVKYIIHIASVMPLPHLSDFENDIVIPTVKATIGILESAQKVDSVKRIVFTSSVSSLLPTHSSNPLVGGSEGIVYNEKSRAPTTTGPYLSNMEAYNAAKVLSLEATYAFMDRARPDFDVINIHPGYIIGRDETVTDPRDIMKGTNALVFAQLLGQPLPGQPRPAPTVGSAVVDLDDVAKLHVDSLDSSVVGNQSFLATSESPQGGTWGNVLDIVKRRYPKEVAEGIFTVDSVPLQTQHVMFDSTHTEETFKFKFKSFEDQIIGAVEYYLELLGRK